MTNQTASATIRSAEKAYFQACADLVAVRARRLDNMGPEWAAEDRKAAAWEALQAARELAV
jgi:hypothetical protein